MTREVSDMPDDLGTVNIKGARLGREIEVMRQRYQKHRDTLEQMAAEAPTELLAIEYRRLQTSIDDSLRKLSELERGAGASSAESAAVVANARRPTEPGDRLISHPVGESSWRDNPAVTAGAPIGGSRAPLIALGGLAVLVILGFLVVRSSRNRPAPSDRTGDRTTTVASSGRPAPETVAPLPDPETAPASTLTVNPATADYGMIRRGTRAVRQFELRNSGSTALQVKVNRSDCRCLYYDYLETVPARGKETLTITVDGARAKTGTLDQTVQLVTKSDGSPLATAGVHAKIK
jgi:hypothetical protein